MKKIFIVMCMIFLFSGCTNVHNLNYDSILQNISKESYRKNTYRTGYKYYLPRNMHVSNSSLYNEVLEDEFNKYYLYVDVVSYYKKVENEYKINDNAIYSKKISYDDKYGYAEINLLKNDKYLVEIMYNYAKIEVIVDKSNSNEAIFSAINILKSIEYNDNIIANILGDDVLNFYEEEFNIFNTKGSEQNYITVEDDYQEEEVKIPDPDLIN